MRQSTVMANAVIKRRIKEGHKSLKKLTVAMKHFIEQKEIQIQYLNLIKEDNINPFMNIL